MSFCSREIFASWLALFLSKPAYHRRFEGGTFSVFSFTQTFQDSCFPLLFFGEAFSLCFHFSFSLVFFALGRVLLSIWIWLGEREGC